MATSTFKKLNLKDQTSIVVVDAPRTFEPELKSLTGVTIARSVPEAGGVVFAIAFVNKQDRLNELATQLTRAADGDAILWFAYPKKSSKRLTCEFDRDSGWDVLGEAGFEPVRAVAIDEDWSALRFRRVASIRTMKRDPSRALSREGRRKSNPK